MRSETSFLLCVGRFGKACRSASSHSVQGPAGRRDESGTSPHPPPGVDTVAPESAQRLEALDGLRAIAIVLVLLNHLTPEHNSNQGLRSLVFKVADIGWSGVDLFFVLSGFLITGILLRAKKRQQPMWLFMARRMLRIVPAYFLALCTVFFLVPFFLGLYPVPDMARQWPYWFYVSNYFRAGYEPLAGWFGTAHFWSLAVEMQFYLLWPLFVYRLTPRWMWRAGVGLLLLAYTCRAVGAWMDANWTVTVGWLPMRMDGLIIGSLIALAVQEGLSYRSVRKYAILLAVTGFVLAALIAWYDRAGGLLKAKDGFDMVVRVALPGLLSITYGAVLWICLQRNALATLLGGSWFKPLARYSYGLYIIHYLLLPVYLHFFGVPMLMRLTDGSHDAAVYLHFVLASGISVVLAMLSYHLFEVHFLRLKARI